MKELTVDTCPPPCAELDLSFFATGATQHVFFESARPESGWLYKIPAAFGYILPFRIGFRTMTPWNPYLAVLQDVCFRLPSRLVNWTNHRAENIVDKRRPESRAINFLATIFARSLAGCGDFLLAPYFRRALAVRFRNMLSILSKIPWSGVDGALLPYRIIADLPMTLRVEGKVHRHRGPVLIQRKAQRFIERSEGLESFDWGQLVAAQHQLWRNGVALSDASEVLGPSNWSLLDGRVLLGDTGSLTIDYNQAMQTLAPEILKLREQRVLWYLHGAERRRGIEYLAFIRTEINPARLAQLWKADVKD